MLRANTDFISGHITFGDAVRIAYLFRNPWKLMPDFTYNIILPINNIVI